MVGTINTIAPRSADNTALMEFVSLADTDVKQYRTKIAQRTTKRDNKKKNEPPTESEG